MTAVATALIRAVHTRCDSSRLLEDPHADSLISDSERALLLERFLLMVSPAEREEIRQLKDRDRALERAVHANPAYGTILARSRYAEDQLATAVVRGVRQYVLLGAGFDTFAFRCANLEQQLQIIEIDYPATQALKRERLAQAGLKPPANVCFVAADLERESVAAALSRSPFRRGDLAFFTCLGVTQFLTRQTNLETLRAIGSSASRGSELVFDYLETEAFSPGRAAEEINRMRAERAATEERWQSGFDPMQLGVDLRSVGFTLIEDLDPRTLEQRYCAARTDGLRMIAHAHVARARVT